MENSILSTERILSIVFLSIFILAIIGNSLAFVIFQTNKEMRKSSTITFLSFVAILDILSLLNWNLSAILNPNFSIKLENINSISCKILSFIQFFSFQSSAIILSCSTVDRYFTICKIPGSFASRLKLFSAPKSAKLWSFSIIAIVGLMNSHLLILNGYKKQNFLISRKNDSNFECYWYTEYFNIQNIWEMVHLFTYSIIPSLLMMTFNLMLVQRINSLKNNKQVKNKYLKNSDSKIISKKSKMSITLISTVLAFICTSLPSRIYFTFFFQIKWSYLRIFFHISEFSNHCIIFVVCFITNKYFRKIIFNFFKI